MDGGHFPSRGFDSYRPLPPTSKTHNLILKLGEPGNSPTYCIWDWKNTITDLGHEKRDWKNTKNELEHEYGIGELEEHKEFLLDTNTKNELEREKGIGKTRGLSFDTRKRIRKTQGMSLKKKKGIRETHGMSLNKKREFGKRRA